jgi:hypothetical protein
MLFARRVFQAAAVLGLILLAPMFFLEARMNEQFPPPITHPELYYGLVSVAFVFQFFYLWVASDPVRLRTGMLISAAAKLAVAIPYFILVAIGRTPAASLGFPAFDAVFAILFLVAWKKTPSV